MMKKGPLTHAHTLCSAASLTLALLMHTTPVMAETSTTCELPETVIAGDQRRPLRVDADRTHSRAQALDPLNEWTRWKWAFGLLSPHMWRGEVAIHLYPVRKTAFLSQYDDVDSVDIVKFFLACKAEGRYRAIPAKISKMEEERATETALNEEGSEWDGFVGMTIAPEGTTPELAVHANLYDFGTEGQNSR